MLDLGGLNSRSRASGDLHVQSHAVLRQVLRDQEDDFLDELRQVGRLAIDRTRAKPGKAEHAARDGRGPLGTLDDLLERPLAVGRIGVAQAELGVVEDRRQGVVQLVEDATGQNPEAADALKRDHLFP